MFEINLDLNNINLETVEKLHKYYRNRDCHKLAWFCLAGEGRVVKYQWIE